MFLVGDFYQHTYDTSRDGNVNKNLYSNYDNYVNKFKLSIPQLEFDKTSFSKSKRCSKEVCSFINEQLDIDIESYFNHTSIVKEITDEDEIKNIINFFIKIAKNMILEMLIIGEIQKEKLMMTFV